MKSPYRRAVDRPLQSAVAWLLTLVSGVLCGSVAAQAQAPVEDATASRQPTSWLEPRISVQHTATSNVRLNDTQRSDQVTEVSTGLRWVGNTARIKGFFDYSLTAIHYAHATGAQHLRHRLNTNATIEVIDQIFFVDVAGVAAMQPRSVFDTQAGLSAANPDDVQARSFRVSPYLRGRLGSTAAYEARYSVQDTRAGTANRSALLTQDALLSLDNKRSGQALGWMLEARQQVLDYSLGRRIETGTLRGGLTYAVTPQLQVSGMVGAESTNQLSPVRETSSIVGAGIVWQPSPRTRLSLQRERRYFGEAHDVSLEHRTGRTVWRYTDHKGISSGQGSQGASLGSLFDLLDANYAATETDPVRRTQLVMAEIEQLGLPADFQVFPDFLQSASTVQRLQQLSFALLGRRSIVTLAATRSDNQRVDDSTLPLGNDFGANPHIRRHGWSLLLAHRLTPHSALNASLAEQRSVGTGTGLQRRSRSLQVGWVTRVAERTSLGIQVRRVISDGAARPYNESAIVATLTHRF